MLLDLETFKRQLQEKTATPGRRGLSWIDFEDLDVIRDMESVIEKRNELIEALRDTLEAHENSVSVLENRFVFPITNKEESTVPCFEISLVLKLDDGMPIETLASLIKTNEFVADVKKVKFNEMVLYEPCLSVSGFVFNLNVEEKNVGRPQARIVLECLSDLGELNLNGSYGWDGLIKSLQEKKEMESMEPLSGGAGKRPKWL